MNFFEGGGICQVISRLDQASKVVKCTFGVDREEGQIKCLNREESDDIAFQDGTSTTGMTSDFLPSTNSFKGTEIRLIVPGGAIGSAAERLKAYFQRLRLTAHCLNCDISYVALL
jgi:hypothetical protein